MKETKRNFLFGATYAVMSWILFIIADAIDEYCLDEGCVLNGILLVSLPIVALTLYIIHVLKKHPAVKPLVFWHIGMILSFLLCWGIVCAGVFEEMYWFPVYQSKRGDFIDLNGIEYMFYGFTVLIAFTALCIVFHIFRFAVQKLRERKEKLQ